MIDIHSHILFGIDDGAVTLEESILHIKKAVEIGYDGIVCTSHYKISLFENKNYDKNFKILKDEIKKRKIPMEIYKGNEFNLKGDILKNLSKLNSINNTRYILVEFPYGLFYKGCISILDEIIQKGYIPIIAHIERYPYIKMKEFIQMYEKKIIFQMNIRTVKNMSKKIKFLLKNGCIQVIGTDSHRIGMRDYNVLEYLKRLREIVGQKRFNELVDENPKKIIRGEFIGFRTLGGLHGNEKVWFSSSFFSIIWKKLLNGINSGRCYK